MRDLQDLVPKEGWESALDKIKEILVLPWDRQEAVTGVYQLVKRFLATDLQEHRITNVEIKGNFLYNTGDCPPVVREFRYIGDVELQHRATSERIGIDWKTGGNIDGAWIDQHRRSWQWKLYCLASGWSKLEYRILETPVSSVPVIRKLVLELTDKEAALTSTWLEQQFEQMDRLLTYTAPWPRAMNPLICRAYRRECPYYNDCSGITWPAEIPIINRLSYSSITSMNECPEKFRREHLVRIEETGNTYKKDLGSAIHAGVSEIYRSIGALDKAGDPMYNGV